jgi:hypothetical protein
MSDAQSDGMDRIFPLQKQKTMNEKYRRLTTEELKKLGITSNFEKTEVYRRFAKSYYPNTAHTMLLAINSEYNDNTYDNSVKYVVVYDKEGNEIPPNKKTATNCRDDWYNLPIPHCSNYDYQNGGESNEPIDDLVIQLTDELPELYVKE